MQRGLAAFAVVIYHCLMVFPRLAPTLGGAGIPFHAPDGGGLPVLLLTASPPSLLWSGREAVLLFFVLSGFVLALPFLSDRRPSYLPFAAKRFCRLILPSAAVVLPVAALVPILAPTERPDLSQWFNTAWRQEITPGLHVKAPWSTVETFNVRNQQVVFAGKQATTDYTGGSALGPDITVRHERDGHLRAVGGRHP